MLKIIPYLRRFEHAFQKIVTDYNFITAITVLFFLPQQPHLILGGGSGFFAKSLAYPYLGEEEGLRWTAEQMKQMFHNHKHERDAENGISPHTMKYARFRGRLYPYGYCGVNIL